MRRRWREDLIVDRNWQFTCSPVHQQRCVCVICPCKRSQVLHLSPSLGSRWKVELGKSNESCCHFCHFTSSIRTIPTSKPQQRLQSWQKNLLEMLPTLGSAIYSSASLQSHCASHVQFVSKVLAFQNAEADKTTQNAEADTADLEDMQRLSVEANGVGFRW